MKSSNQVGGQRNRSVPRGKTLPQHSRLISVKSRQENRCEAGSSRWNKLIPSFIINGEDLSRFAGLAAARGALLLDIKFRWKEANACPAIALV